jgi:hypothetical protein
MFHKVERRLRDARVVAVLGNAELRADHKADFQDKENMEPVAKRLASAAQVNPEMRPTKSTRPGRWCSTIPPMPSGTSA